MFDTVCVPSGMGDVSWAYSKLKHLGKLKYEVADGWPHRTVPYLELLPEVESASYGPFNFQDIIKMEQLHAMGDSPKLVQLQEYAGSTIFLQPNRHLEMGLPLADWLPELPCDYHYDVNIPERDVTRAIQRLATYKRPITGISAASYRGSEAWKTWGYEDWSTFLKMWKAEVGGTILLLGGFWDDLTDTLSNEGYPSLVGKTTIGCALEIQRMLDWYIGFSSGLGIMRTVFRKPTFMLWPDFQAELSTSWADPADLESGLYMSQLWRAPNLAIKRARLWLRRNG